MEFVNLPSGYQQVEWLESTGTQWIDSGVSVYPNGFHAILECQISKYPNVGDVTQSNGLIGGYYGQNAKGTYLRMYMNGANNAGGYSIGLIASYFNNVFANTFELNGEPVEIDICCLKGKQHLKLNGSKKYEYTYDFSMQDTLSGYTVPVLAQYSITASARRINKGMKIWGCQFLDEQDNLIRNFIPVIRLSDSKPGMYDLVTEQFFTNAGTGEFSTPAQFRANYLRRQIILASSPHLKTLIGTGSLQFTPHVAANLKECKIYFTPKQDLHGYSKPWVGGAGKNMIPDGTDTSNGYLANSILNLDNTTTTLSGWYVSEYFNVVAGNTYTWSSVNSNINTASICFYDENKAYISGEKANKELPKTLVAPEGAVYCRASQNNSSTYLCQLEVGSTATTVEPYSNVCPITGWNGIGIRATGKNLWGGYSAARDIYSLKSGMVSFGSDSNGNYVKLVNLSGSAVNFTKYIKFKTNTQYTLLIKCRCTSNTNANIRFIYTDGSHGTFNPSTSSTPNVMKIVSAAGKTVSHIENLHRSNTTFIYYDDCFGLFEGNVSVNDYEPYKGIVMEVPFDQTIYGGYIDLLRGEVVDQYVNRKVKDLVVNKTGGSGVWLHRFDIKPVWRTGSGATYEANTQTMEYSYNDMMPKGLATSNYSYRVYSGLFDVYDDTVSTAAEFKEHWADNHFVYRVIQKYYNHYSLTPQTIKTLKGLNNIFTNANGNIEIKYWSY